MSKQLRLDVAQLTDVGRKRSQNEDNMAYVIPKDPQVMARKGALFIVADGMGGHAAGEVASEIAVDTVSNAYYQDDNDEVTVSLVNAIRRANSLIHQRAAENMLRSGMGTTCVAAVFKGNMAYIANVGDSRAYLVRRGQIKQVSQDHSWVEEQVRAGLLTREQARSHAQRNVITRCLGTQSEVEVDIFSEPLDENDSLVLCTDGLSGLVGEEDLQSIVSQYAPQESVYHLVERANENGGSDNITAIVIRVLEVGWEPPANSLRPVPVGGREIGEDSAVTLGRLPGAALSMPARTENGRGPLRTPGDSPLFAAPGSMVMPVAQIQPGVMPARSKKNRLLYPTLAVLILLLVALVGVGAYYFLGSKTDVDANLTQATALIGQARTNASSKPADALQQLAQAQKLMRETGTASMSSGQQQRFTSLKTSFTTTAKTAIVGYNQQGMITTLPCVNGAPVALTLGSTLTGASGLIMLQDGKNGNFSYALGDDHKLYQVDTNHSLVKPYTPANNAQVSAVASDPQNTQRSFALTTLPGQGNNPTTYSLVPLTADQGKGGALTEGHVSTIDANLTKNGQTPHLITAWGADVYIVLTSTALPNQATILDYNVDQPNAMPQSSKISVSTGLVSITAFPNKQLFLLDSAGNVQSFQFSSNASLPGSVLVQSPIVTPLNVAAQDVSLDTSLAVPTVAASPAAQQSFLSVPAGANLMVSGFANNTPHLYLADGTNHRVLDLTMQAAATTTPTPTVGGATTTPTATTAATNSGTPTATAPAGTATATKTAGGGVAASGTTVTVQLSQQYVSASVLALVKSIALDSTGAQLNLLTQTDQHTATLNIVPISVDKNACVAAS